MKNQTFDYGHRIREEHHIKSLENIFIHTIEENFLKLQGKNDFSIAKGLQKTKEIGWKI